MALFSLQLALFNFHDHATFLSDFIFANVSFSHFRSRLFKKLKPLFYQNQPQDRVKDLRHFLTFHDQHLSTFAEHFLSFSITYFYFFAEVTFYFQSRPHTPFKRSTPRSRFFIITHAHFYFFAQALLTRNQAHDFSLNQENLFIKIKIVVTTPTTPPTPHLFTQNQKSRI